VIRHSLLPLVFRVETLDPRPVLRLALQLSGLLDESNYTDAALVALSLAKSIVERFGPLVSPPSSIHSFTLLRREAQLDMRKKPGSSWFTSLMARAEEQIQGDVNRSITLTLVRASSLFHQATIVTTKHAYESLAPMTSRYADAILADLEFRKPADITAVNLAELFMFDAVASSRLRRSGWEESARQAVATASHLYLQSGARITAEFWNTVARETFDANADSFRILQPLTTYVRGPLRQASKDDVEAILAHLKNIRFVENPEIDEADTI
jgi:hypothetical protein